MSDFMKNLSEAIRKAEEIKTTGLVKITIVQNNISKYAFNELRVKLFSWIVHHELKTIEMTLRENPRNNLIADILLRNVDTDDYDNLVQEFKVRKNKYTDNFDFEYNPNFPMEE